MARSLSPTPPQLDACSRAQLKTLATNSARDESATRLTGLFLGTCPDRYALWASTVYLGGKVLAVPAWTALGQRVLARFARSIPADLTLETLGRLAQNLLYLPLPPTAPL